MPWNSWASPRLRLGVAALAGARHGRSVPFRRHRVPLGHRAAQRARQERPDPGQGEHAGRGRGPAPHGLRVAGRHVRVGRQAVHLGLVEQQEERAVAADAVVRVVPVEPGLGDAEVVQLRRAAGRPARAARPASRTGWSRSGTPARRPAPCRRAAGRSTACTSGPARRRAGGRSRRTGSRRRSSRSRCRCPAARRPCRTRCGTARRWGRRPGSRRACSACTRPRPSASGTPCGPRRRARRPAC